MSNMAVDSWLPHRFAALSDRLTMRDGGGADGRGAAAILLYTGGDVSHLVVMYSINVFVTFSLSQIAMCRHWIQERLRPGASEEEPGRPHRRARAVRMHPRHHR
jgi:hypothetical protein